MRGQEMSDEKRLTLNANTNLTKPILKLIDVVGNAIGTLYEPTRRRRQADADLYAAGRAAEAARLHAGGEADALAKSAVAEREALEQRAKAQATAEIILAQSGQEVAEIEDRARERIRRREQRRQRNLEAIAKKAIEATAQITESEGSTDSLPDDDWVHRFLRSCEDISNEEMQVLWGKLLAGEVACPGTFSLQTLATVKLLGKKDAEVFTMFCSYVWRHPPGNLDPVAVGFYDPTKDEITPELSFNDLDLLQNAGLIRQVPHNAEYGSPFVTDEVREWPFAYFGKLFLVKGQSNCSTLPVGHTFLTRVGRELAPISGAVADLDYLERVLEAWRRHGATVTEIDIADPNP
jgi:hypothetical protein